MPKIGDKKYEVVGFTRESGEHEDLLDVPQETLFETADQDEAQRFMKETDHPHSVWMETYEWNHVSYHGQDWEWID